MNDKNGYRGALLDVDAGLGVVAVEARLQPAGLPCAPRLHGSINQAPECIHATSNTKTQLARHRIRPELDGDLQSSAGMQWVYFSWTNQAPECS